MTPCKRFSRVTLDLETLLWNARQAEKAATEGIAQLERKQAVDALRLSLETLYASSMQIDNALATE